jgi:hypothetical protein
MNNKLRQFISLLKEDLEIIVSTSIGVFLFVLFFQPFPLEKFDFNNKLLFVAGLGTIAFLIMVTVSAVFPGLIREYDQDNKEAILPSYLSGFLLMSLTSVAFAFFLRYVGFVNITFYIMFKVGLICLALPVILRLSGKIKDLKQQNETLVIEKKLIQKQIEHYEEDSLNKSIELVSENINENLKLKIADVALIKSADNYVEIVYKEEDDFKKKLLRNTNFMRCHRICIVNSHYIEKLHRTYNNHWLSIKGYDEQIPVSRQYLLKVKETQ